jgi:proliferating cell nuclear antigen
MFKIVLSDVDLLKNSIPIISEIIDEGIFRVDQNGISMLSPDRAMVAVIDLKILSTAFDEFNVKGEDFLGLNMANISAVIKRVKSGDKIILEREEGGNTLKVSIKGTGMRVFNIPLLDIKAEKPPVDKLAFTSKIELESRIVEEGVSDADIIGDSIIFEANPNHFRMSAKGDVSSSHLDLNKQDKGLLDLKVTANVKSQYPIDYLKKMIKAGKISEQMVLEFGNDYPLRLGFKSIDKMQLSFILAPRVEA